MNTCDVIVIGGGLVGAAVAYGAARLGASVVVLDEGDDAFRASRGNFGLVWVQGKGAGMRSYARWTIKSASLWKKLADEVAQDSDVDVRLAQPGGFHFCFSDQEMLMRSSQLRGIERDLQDAYPFQMLSRGDLKSRLPGVGPDVVGASYTPMDGHVNPLKLLRALHVACKKRHGRIFGGKRVTFIKRVAKTFEIDAGGERYFAPRVVLAAGLGNLKLAAHVGLHVPVRPNRGHILVTERLPPFLSYPTTYVRQTDEGTVQLGDSMEDVGLDDRTSTDVLTEIARRGVRCFPALGSGNLIRAWAALRVMTPDGYPIYQESPRFPGAFVITCHSGVTLAPNHVHSIAPWILTGGLPAGIENFSANRFQKSTDNFSYAE